MIATQLKIDIGIPIDTLFDIERMRGIVGRLVDDTGFRAFGEIIGYTVNHTEIGIVFDSGVIYVTHPLSLCRLLFYPITVVQ